MRKYKKLIIPDRISRNNEDMVSKQDIYCGKSACDDIGCHECLFEDRHINQFKEWYLAKNKKHTIGAE